MTADLKTFVDIDASPERVWQVLTDLPAYPEWNPLIIRAEGPLVVGARLLVITPPVSALVQPTLRPTVLEVVPFRRVRLWSRLDRLAIPGLFDVDFTMTITDHDCGVRLWHQDRFGGLLTPLMIRSLNRYRLPAAYNAMQEALKHRVEGTPASRPG